MIRDLGVCQASPQSPPCTVIRSSPSRVTKDKLGPQARLALQAQEGLLETQGKMAPEECQESPVNQGTQENKAQWVLWGLQDKRVLLEHMEFQG